MVRKKDRFWAYANELDIKNFQCNFCERKFAGGISRIKSHLSGIKGRDIEICPKVPPDVRADAQQAIGIVVVGDDLPSQGERKTRYNKGRARAEAKQPIGSPSKKGKDIIGVSNDKIIVIGDDDYPSCTALTCSDSDSKKKAFVDEKFINFQIANGFFKEDSQTFVEFVKAVSEYGPNYELPNWYNHLTKYMTDQDQEDEVLRYEQGVKESWTETGCTLMLIYGEDSLANYEVQVFAYCPKGTLFLTSLPGQGISACLVHVIEGIGPHHIVQIIDEKESVGVLGDLFDTVCHPRVLSTSCLNKEFTYIVSNIELQNGNLLDVAEMVYICMRKFNMEFAMKIFHKYKKYCKIVPYMCLLLSVVELESEVIRVVQSLDTSSDLVKCVTLDFGPWGNKCSILLMFCSKLFV